MINVLTSLNWFTAFASATWLTYVYLFIIAILVVFIVWNMFEEHDIMLQIDAALVLIPLILRLFLIK